ncbi:response regulator [Desulfonema magnum]|uniref:Two component system response regulator n=1 Tax=Desulfonema magnum TaxID=45655 RepID=A0A975BGS6_9BACT|nr:response regulator [Desulfonema magnum]QTA85141.1 Two component system response regulator [Desulfonema magnum]
MKRKVLVVDDESDMVIFLSTLLDTHGFKPVIAENKSEGLRKAAEEEPACVILNAMMSDENGIDMYIRLRRDEHLKKIPVVMLSAIPQKTFFQYRKFRDGSFSQGIPEPEAYLEKPPEAEELIRQVRTLTHG